MINKFYKQKAHINIIAVLLSFVLFSSCSARRDRKSFEICVIEELPHSWKSFALDAIDNFIYENSESYDATIRETISTKSPELAQKYDEILTILECYRSNNSSVYHKKLLNLSHELRKKQNTELKKEREKTEKELPTNQDLGITKEMEAELEKVKEEQYALCIKILERTDFDYHLFTIKDISVEDTLSSLFIEKIAILKISLKGLPDLEVYFFNDTETCSWTSFYSYVNFYDDEYLMKRFNEI